MENTNIIENGEVMEAFDEVTTYGSGTGLKLFGGAVIGAALLYGGQKLFKKIKERKEQNVATVKPYKGRDNEVVEDDE